LGESKTFGWITTSREKRSHVRVASKGVNVSMSGGEKQVVGK